MTVNVNLIVRIQLHRACSEPCHKVSYGGGLTGGPPRAIVFLSITDHERTTRMNCPDQSHTSDTPLIDPRTLLILALAGAVGVLVGLGGGLGAGVVAGLGAAALLHGLVGKH
jgi:hypothetical protein